MSLFTRVSFVLLCATFKGIIPFIRQSIVPNRVFLCYCMLEGKNNTFSLLWEIRPIFMQTCFSPPTWPPWKPSITSFISATLLSRHSCQLFANVSSSAMFFPPLRSLRPLLHCFRGYLCPCFHPEGFFPLNRIPLIRYIVVKSDRPTRGCELPAPRLHKCFEPDFNMYSCFFKL